MELFRASKKIFFLAVFFLIAGQAYTQNEVSETAPVLTLNQTMQTLYMADNAGENEFRWDPFFRDGSFSIGGHYGIFPTALAAGQTGFLMVDHRDVYPVPLPYLLNGELFFPEPFVMTAKEAFTRSINENDSRYQITTIIIDPGHGGKDTGAEGVETTVNGIRQKVLEKTVNLNASRLLRDMLVRAYPGKRILMTRESDITVSLQERTDIANSVPVRRNEAVIYISIHANASRNSGARGYEVWYLSPEHRRTLLDDTSYSDSPGLRKIMNSLMEEGITVESTKLGVSILDSMEAAMGASIPSRGLKAEEWFVVRHSRMPAVLVELGFVTNREDARLMTGDTHLNNIVEALYNGIRDFVDDFEQSGGFVAAR